MNGLSCVHGRIERLYLIAHDLFKGITTGVFEEQIPSKKYKKQIEIVEKLFKEEDANNEHKELNTTLVTRDKISALFKSGHKMSLFQTLVQQKNKKKIIWLMQTLKL